MKPWSAGMLVMYSTVLQHVPAMGHVAIHVHQRANLLHSETETALQRGKNKPITV